MEAKELKITIPENHEIDWQESAKQEKIVFKKINNKPRSWEEYCKNYRGKWYCISVMAEIIEGETSYGLNSRCVQNVLPSKELAEASLAMMQLMSLRQAWIGDWEPDWSNEYLIKYCIIGKSCDFEVCRFNKCRYPLSFPTEEMAKDFMYCFKDLLEIAKPLL